jgi:hypothetical protein
MRGEGRCEDAWGGEGRGGERISGEGRGGVVDLGCMLAALLVRSEIAL